MLFFEKLRRSKPTLNYVNPIDVRHRVQAIRNRVGYSDVKLGDLFTIAGEPERVRPSIPIVVDEPDIPRLRPDQVPSLYPPDQQPPTWI